MKGKAKGKKGKKSNPGLTGRQLADSMVGGLTGGRPAQFGTSAKPVRKSGRGGR